MKKTVLTLFLIMLSVSLFSEHFWDFETDPWVQGWTSLKKDQGFNSPQRWAWEIYNWQSQRPPDPLTMSMWCSSYQAGSFVLRDTLISPSISDSMNYWKYLKYGLGYNYRSGGDYDTASVLIRTYSGTGWSEWQQIKFYYGSDLNAVWDSVDINVYTYLKDSLQFAFAYRGGTSSSPDYYFGIDNVSLITEVPTFAGPVLPPTGPSNIFTGQLNSYTSETVAGAVEYQFYWGDGTFSAWTVTPTHDKSWGFVGTHYIASRCRLISHPMDSISYWSNPLQVKVMNENTIFYCGDDPADTMGFPTLNRRNWEFGIPTNVGPDSVRSGINCWGTILDGNYNQDASYLLIPYQDLSMCDSAVIKFWMWYDTDPGEDGAVLLISSSETFGTAWSYSGRYWDTIPVGNLLPPHNDSAYFTWRNCYASAFSGYSEWQLFELNLKPYLNLANVNVLWRLAARNGDVGLPGLYIDDIHLDTFMRITGPSAAPTGIDSGLTENTYIYTSATPAGGPYEYQFDWGNGDLSPWLAGPSGSYDWDSVGTYCVKSRVRLSASPSEISYFSDPLKVVIVKPRTVRYWGFEVDVGDWFRYNPRDWEFGVPKSGPFSAHTGTNVIATDLDNVYNADYSYIWSPEMDLSLADSAVMYYYMWYDSKTADGISIYVGTDSLDDTTGTWDRQSTSWDSLRSDLVTPNYSGIFFSDWRNANIAGYSGEGKTWQQYSINLTPWLKCQDLTIMMRLAANGSPWSNPGFYIDDIRVDTFMFPFYGPICAPTGPTVGFVSSNYTYESDTATPQTNVYQYQFDWGDGQYSTWETSLTRAHSWTAAGIYQIRTKARLVSDTSFVGPWSPHLSVEIGTDAYFAMPWDFEEGYQGWTPTTHWTREVYNYQGATWQCPGSESYSLWFNTLGLPTVCDTTMSPKVPNAIDNKYLIWSGLLNNRWGYETDTVNIIIRVRKNTVWTDWTSVYLYTIETNANWFNIEVPTLEGSDSFQMAIIYTHHHDNTTTNRYFAIDNIQLANKPYIEEIVYSFEDLAHIDWVHTNNAVLPNGWTRAVDNYISALEVSNAGDYSLWIGNTSSHTVPLLDSTFSPTDWNPFDLQYLKYSIAFNNNYDTIKVIVSGLVDTGWTDWTAVKTYERATTPNFWGVDSVDLSGSFSQCSRLSVGFVYFSTIDNGAMVVDNISLNMRQGKDASIVGGDDPINGMFVDPGNYPVKATFKNNGTNTANFTVKAIVVDITDGSIMMNEEVDINNLLYLDSTIIDFGNFTLTNEHEYIKTIVVDYPGDHIKSNDTLENIIHCGNPNWVQLPDMPIALSGACSWKDEEDNIHVFGDTKHLSYNITNNVWTVEGDLPFEISNAKCAVSNKKVFVVGDFQDNEDKMLIYDIENETYSTVDLPDGVVDPSVVSVYGVGDDYIYIIGSDLKDRPKTYVYDDINNTYLYASLVPYGFSNGIASTSNGNIVLAAGNLVGSNFYIGKPNLASPTIVNWTTEYHSPVGNIDNASGGALGDFLLVTGGKKDSSYTKDCYLYQIEKGWYDLPDYPIEISNASVIADIIESSSLSDSGLISNFYVLGGENSGGDIRSFYMFTLTSARKMSANQEEEGNTSAFGFTAALASSNMFRDKVDLRLSLPKNALVEWNIYDISGREVQQMNAYLTAGVHTLTWDGSDNRGVGVSAGTYFYMLSTPFGSASGKIVHIQ